MAMNAELAERPGASGHAIGHASGHIAGCMSVCNSRQEARNTGGAFGKPRVLLHVAGCVLHPPLAEGGEPYVE